MTEVNYDLKLRWYCNPAEGFKLFSYWPSGFAFVYYLYRAEILRPAASVTDETAENQLKQPERLLITVVERAGVVMPVINSVWAVLSLLPAFDVVEIYDRRSATTYAVQNVQVEDAGEDTEGIGLVRVTFEVEAVTRTYCTQNYTLVSC